MTNFHEVRLSPKISYGASGGPRRKTEIVELYSGFEERNSPWAESRRSYNVAYGIRDTDDVYDVMSFFEAREGSLYGFRYKDWADWKSTKPLKENVIAPTDQVIGAGNGSLTQFQLIKTYQDTANTVTRYIQKPVIDTVRIAFDSIEQTSGWVVNTTTGIVTFSSAPPSGVVITAGYEFDVPVRFNADALSINLANFEKGEIPDISLVEVRVTPGVFTTGIRLSSFNSPLDAYLFTGGNAVDFEAGKIPFDDGSFFDDGSGFAVTNMLPPLLAQQANQGDTLIYLTGSVWPFIPTGGQIFIGTEVYVVQSKPAYNQLTLTMPLTTTYPINTLMDVSILAGSE